MYSVYKITNKTNGKLYIGYSKNITQRWRNHIKCSNTKSKKEYNYPLYISMRKYGIDAFSLNIIDEFSDKAAACALEIKLIAELNTQNRDFGYNIHAGGMGGYTDYTNHSKRFTGVGNPMYGRSMPEETKLKLSKSISEWRNNTPAGALHSQMQKNRMSGTKNWNYGTPMPEDRKLKMIATKKLKPTVPTYITKYTLINLITKQTYIAFGVYEYMKMLKVYKLSQCGAESIMRGNTTKSTVWANYHICRERVLNPLLVELKSQNKCLTDESTGI